MKKFFKKNRCPSLEGEAGEVIIYLLLTIFIFSVLMLPMINGIVSRVRTLKTVIDREQAMQIAEAGINYYRWHLAHYPTDYQDGTGGPGPYVHTYKDYDTQEVLGQYSLEITAPFAGSTIVTIKSTGSTAKNPGVLRTITAKYGIPSLAQYSFLSNDIIWIGDNEAVTGMMQANNGIRFDGTTNAPVKSTKETYTCSSRQGSPCPALKDGVWGNAPQSIKNFWQFPVPTVDFSALTANLANMKSDSQSGGIYLPPSNAQGYSLVFNSNGTITIYKVTSLRSNPTGMDVNGSYHSEDIDYQNRSLVSTQAMPSNGIIYIEDKVWVQGTVKGRAMLAAAKLPYNPSTAPSIYIPNNIVYAAKDGTNVLGLLAQKDVVVTYYAPTNLEINAAMIAQNGSAQMFYYSFGAGIKNSITVYGSIMTYGQWTWTWVNGAGIVLSGYRNTASNYDSDLLYAAPPSFPLSSEGYQFIGWNSN